MAPASGRIATVVGDDGSAIQALLAATAAGWCAAGVKVVGVIAEAHGMPERSCTAGVLRDIVSGASYPIYLETVPSHTSCHLDTAGVDAACASVLDQLSGSDVVVLSKFGKLEAMRQGLAPVFEAAIAAGKPVLTTVSEKHRDAWRAFAPDAAPLPADGVAISSWWRTQQPH